MDSRIKSFALFGSLLALSAVDGQAQDIYSTDFTALGGWSVQTGCTAGYSWATDATPASRSCGAPAFLSAPAALNFNNGLDIGGWGVHGGADITCGGATSPAIDLGTAGAGAARSC